MHTLRRNADDTWAVGFAEVTSSGVGHVKTDFNVLFDLLKLYQAIDVVNALNGGSGDTKDVIRYVSGKEVI